MTRNTIQKRIIFLILVASITGNVQRTLAAAPQSDTDKDAEFSRRTQQHAADMKKYLSQGQEALNMGADINMRRIEVSDYGCLTFLEYAVYKSETLFTQSLLEKKADPNSASPMNLNRTPLHIASHHHDVEIIYSLLEHKANVHAQESSHNLTPLEVALQAQHHERQAQAAGALIFAGSPIPPIKYLKSIIKEHKVPAATLIAMKESVRERQMITTLFLKHKPLAGYLPTSLIELAQQYVSAAVPLEVDQEEATNERALLALPLEQNTGNRVIRAFAHPLTKLMMSMIQSIREDI